jgi:hypothetical protein
MSVNFAYKHPYQGSLKCHKILQHGANGFTYPPKEVVLQVFIALKNPWLSAGFELANFGSNGKHNNHYNNENDKSQSKYSNNVLSRFCTFKTVSLKEKWQ